MGYFRRKIDRARCAAQVAAAAERYSALCLSDWFDASHAQTRASPVRVERPVYLRFAVGKVDACSREHLGVFQACFELRDSGQMIRDDRRRLQDLTRWFNQNLHAPCVPKNAVFWFKSGAQECVSRIWQMIHLLKSYDVVVWMMRSELPGRIVYSDPHQIAAVPWRPRCGRRRPV